MNDYWPWWLGASILGLVMIGFRVVTGRALGVSGLYARILRLRAERKLAASDDALRAALLKATMERFGQQADAGEARGTLARPAPPLSTGLGTAFMACLFLGGLLSRGLSGGGLALGLGNEFTSVVGSGWTAAAALLLGGFFVGFGTQMSGGCTSGHGLNGCAQLRPASLVATAAFFGAAVVVSLLLRS
jgi:uncharacterized membrane protein YedE/YeeE